MQMTDLKERITSDVGVHVCVVYKIIACACTLSAQYLFFLQRTIPIVVWLLQHRQITQVKCILSCM